MIEYSVIIPTYNRNKTLRHSIISLAHQFLKDIEVIVCDDGGTESTYRHMVELKSFELPFEIRYAYQSKKGFRPAAARNMGIALAEGKKLVFINQDIILEPNSLKQFESLRRGSYFTGFKKLVPLQDYVKLSDDAFSNYHKFREAFSGNYGLVPATVSQCAIINKVDAERVGGFDEEFDEYGCEDMDFAWRLYDAGVYGPKSKSWFCYHIEHEYGNPKVSQKSNDMFNYKRKNKLPEGNKVKYPVKTTK